MYKAILVDDEKIVRLALKTIVDWTALGYTVTGSYSSVKTALLEIEDDPPDLIITDIKCRIWMVCSLSSRYGSKNRECGDYCTYQPRKFLLRGGGNSPGG